LPIEKGRREKKESVVIRLSSLHFLPILTTPNNLSHQRGWGKEKKGKERMTGDVALAFSLRLTLACGEWNRREREEKKKRETKVHPSI